LRVCEEITRFILESLTYTRQLKRIRHRIDTLSRTFASHAELVEVRDSSRDVGMRISRHELKRGSCRDLFIANIQRVKESLRVLEEFSKLADKETALKFKKLRYDIYEIEKNITKRIMLIR